MTWTLRNGVQVWVGEPFPEPAEKDLVDYAFCAAPVRKRQRPTCGKPGSGRNAHTRHKEPACALCAAAEREYQQRRREAVAS